MRVAKHDQAVLIKELASPPEVQERSCESMCRLAASLGYSRSSREYGVESGFQEHKMKQTTAKITVSGAHSYRSCSTPTCATLNGWRTGLHPVRLPGPTALPVCSTLYEVWRDRNHHLRLPIGQVFGTSA
jgi:hypothetical protein